jgi:hypothetical protein
MMLHQKTSFSPFFSGSLAFMSGVAWLYTPLVTTFACLLMRVFTFVVSPYLKILCSRH